MKHIKQPENTRELQLRLDRFSQIFGDEVETGLEALLDEFDALYSPANINHADVLHIERTREIIEQYKEAERNILQKFAKKLF